MFVPQSFELREEYDLGWKITDVFPVNSVGIVTARDSLTIHWNAEEAWHTVQDFVSLLPETAREKYKLGADARDWKVTLAQADVKKSGPTRGNLTPIFYRPFDKRYTYYTGTSRGFQCMPRPEVMPNLVNKDNLALIFTRSTSPGRPFNHVFCVQHSMLGRFFTDAACITYFSPLYLYPNGKGRQLNLSPSFIVAFQDQTSLRIAKNAYVAPIASDGPALNLPPDMGMFQEYHGLFSDDSGSADNGVTDTADTYTAENMFNYIYAVFHSPTYRDRYAEFLKMDFPRVPLTSNVPLFRALCLLGQELAALHLMRSPNEQMGVSLTTGSNYVETIPHYEEGTRDEKAPKGKVYINKVQYFAPVTSEVWEFQIGGYRVCEKWLKDRKGRMLSEEDITHYGNIVFALSETIRLMAEIDTVIEAHEGWPLQ